MKDNTSSMPINDEMVKEILIHEYGFRKVYRSEDENIIDYNKFDCVLRIHELHYLFWSDTMNHFSVGLRHENAKGLAGGGYKSWDYMMLPKVIRTIEEAKSLVESVVDFNYVKLICQ